MLQQLHQLRQQQLRQHQQHIQMEIQQRLLLSQTHFKQLHHYQQRQQFFSQLELQHRPSVAMMLQQQSQQHKHNHFFEQDYFNNVDDNTNEHLEDNKITIEDEKIQKNNKNVEKEKNNFNSSIVIKSEKIDNDMNENEPKNFKTTKNNSALSPSKTDTTTDVKAFDNEVLKEKNKVNSLKFSVTAILSNVSKQNGG